MMQDVIIIKKNKIKRGIKIKTELQKSKMKITINKKNTSYFSLVVGAIRNLDDEK